MTDRHRFEIILSADRALSHDEAVRQLRAALKQLIRCYGLRCLRVVETTHKTDDDPPEKNFTES